MSEEIKAKEKVIDSIINDTLTKDYEELIIQFDDLQQENTELKQNICEYKEKYKECDSDCIWAEYETMANSNMELSLENTELKQKLSSIEEYITEHSEESECNFYGIPKCLIFKGSVGKVLEILRGNNNVKN